VTERRRLPVVQPPPKAEERNENDDEGEPRPPWHWIGFGTVAIFGAWLPLAYLAGAVVKRAVEPYVGIAANAEEYAARYAVLGPGDRVRLAAIQLIPHAIAFSLAAFAGGFLVGRFGKGTRPREAAAAGATTALIALGITAGGGFGSIGAALVMIVVVALLAVGTSAWGGKVGVSRRKP
jgi:tRNA-(ms[2]io[6]A)-hydroxylase